MALHYLPFRIHNDTTLCCYGSTVTHPIRVCPSTYSESGWPRQKVIFFIPAVARSQWLTSETYLPATEGSPVWFLPDFSILDPYEHKNGHDRSRERHACYTNKTNALATKTFRSNNRGTYEYQSQKTRSNILTLDGKTSRLNWNQKKTNFLLCDVWRRRNQFHNIDHHIIQSCNYVRFHNIILANILADYFSYNSTRRKT